MANNRELSEFGDFLTVDNTTNNIGIGTTLKITAGGIFVGDTEVIAADGTWGGSNSGLVGAQGAQGVQGAVGAQGAQGVQGTAGVDGAQGAQGVQGAVGAQGAQGRQGAVGAQGAAGAQGNQGVQGATGPVGGATGTDYNDNVKVRFGTGNDLEIYHDTANSYVKDVGTGSLILAGTNVAIQNGTGTENKAVFTTDGAVNLYYDNSNKLQTTSGGINVTGSVTCDGLTSDGTVNVNGNIDMRDNDQMLIGSGDDLRLYHDGTNSYLKE